jgi:hypothetical protein
MMLSTRQMALAAATWLSLPRRQRKRTLWPRAAAGRFALLVM